MEPSDTGKTPAQTKISSLCSALPANLQSHIFAKHVLDLLDSIELPEDARTKLIDGIYSSTARWELYPKPNFAQRRGEISDLMLRLRKITKVRAADEGMEEQNEALVELMWAILDWTKELWIVGVEFGQETEMVHDSLSFLSHAIPTILSADSTTCTCVVPALTIHHEITRTDGTVVEEFTGSSDLVVRSALLCVWRDLFLANLIKPENQAESSWFVSKRLPDMLRDILDVNGFSLGTMWELLDPEVSEDDEDDGYDAGRPTGYAQEDSSDEDYETDESMPPLVDIDASTSPKDVHPKKAERTVHVDIEDDDGDPDYVDEDEDGDDSDEDDEDLSPLEQELDDEDDERVEAMGRLTTIIEQFAVEAFKTNPTAPGYKVLMDKLPTPEKRKRELLEHLVTMPHNPTTFSQAARVLIDEKSTPQIHRLVSANLHLTSRASTAMRDIATYYVGKPSSRALAAPLIYREAKAVMVAMVGEIESAFRGVTSAAKREEVAIIAKSPQAERPANIKLWVDEVQTPKPESLSTEAQTNTTNPLPGDPFGLLAALTATLGFAGPDAPSMAAPVAFDPLEILDPDPTDPDFRPLFDIYRPDYTIAFDMWQHTIANAGKQDKATAALGLKLYSDLYKMAPYLANKAMTEEMKSRCSTERLTNVKAILSKLNAFAIIQIKLSIAHKKAQKGKAKAAAPAPGGSTTSAANSAGLRDFVSAPAAPTTADAATSSTTPSATSSPPAPTPAPAPSPTPSSNLHQAPMVVTGTLPPFLQNLFSMTIPAAYLGLAPTDPLDPSDLDPSVEAPPPPTWDDVD